MRDARYSFVHAPQEPLEQFLRYASGVDELFHRSCDRKLVLPARTMLSTTTHDPLTADGALSGSNPVYKPVLVR